MVVSKLDVAFVLAVAAGLLWIEHNNRVIIGTPAAAEGAPPAASVCPARDDVPFSMACLKYIEGGVLPPLHPPVKPVTITSSVSLDANGVAKSHGPPCPPSNEDAPYSAACIKFMSGWFWQPYPTASAP
jgi:hypothetical protein